MWGQTMFDEYTVVKVMVIALIGLTIINSAFYWGTIIAVRRLLPRMLRRELSQWQQSESQTKPNCSNSSAKR